jgi:hypothetical protein
LQIPTHWIPSVLHLPGVHRLQAVLHPVSWEAWEEFIFAADVFCYLIMYCQPSTLRRELNNEYVLIFCK